MSVKVRDGIKALESALEQMRKLDPELPLRGNFDQGGYGDVNFELESISFSVDCFTEQDMEEEVEADEFDDLPEPHASICANFYSL